MKGRKRLRKKAFDQHKSGYKYLDDLSVSEKKDPCADLCMDLMKVDSMICESASIARLRHTDNPEKLMNIICSSHIALETVMKKYGLECRRSPEGSDFDPETMTAADSLMSTDNPELDGKVAFTAVPSFYKDGVMLEEESVVLYQYKN